MSSLGPALVAGVGCALVMLVVTPRVLRGLPEPAPDGSAEGETKLPYAALAGRSFALGCALVSGVAAGLGWGLATPATRPLWLALASIGVLLALVDARTTWLPLPLTRAAWVLTAAAGLVSGLLGGAELALRSAIGVVTAGLLYLAIWLISRGGFGFGDVRYAPVIGAAAAAESYPTLIWALLLGSVVGAVHGLARLALRRREPFAYAPALLAGAYLALVASAALRT